jgi:repressor LexA
VGSISKLTRAQQRVLDFLQAEVHAGRSSPTLREIAERFGFRSHRAAACHLNALKSKGFVESDPGKARSLRITSPVTKLRSRIVDILLFGSIPAGFADNREQEAEGCVSVDIESIGFKPTRNTFALRVTGDSMIGRHVLNGDIVVLEHEPRTTTRRHVCFKEWTSQGGRAWHHRPSTGHSKPAYFVPPHPSRSAEWLLPSPQTQEACERTCYAPLP